ncbi:MAG: DUF3307 domain-containing protein [Phycisphaerales bacterium]
MIVAILFIHFVADFVVQTGWQAANKSKKLRALAAHVGTYSMCFAPLVFWSKGSALWFVVNIAAHFLTDAITSRFSSKFWRDGKPGKAFWIMIGFDQFIHGATLTGTWLWLVERSQHAY